MVRLSDLAQAERDHLINLPCPTFDTQPWAEGSPISERRVAVISTAGLQRRDDRPYSRGDEDYRCFRWDTPPDEINMSHISVNFDRSGFQQDFNVVFPVERLKEMAADGEIGSVTDFAYSFMDHCRFPRGRSGQCGLTGPGLAQLYPRRERIGTLFGSGRPTEDANQPGLHEHRSYPAAKGNGCRSR